MEGDCFVPQAECGSGRTRGGWNLPYVPLPPPSRFFPVIQDLVLMIGLRVTEDTELGDNLTIKEPPILPTTPFPNRNKRRRRTPAPTEPSS